MVESIEVLPEVVGRVVDVDAEVPSVGPLSVAPEPEVLVGLTLVLSLSLPGSDWQRCSS